MDEKVENDCCGVCCASISTKRMYILLLKVQELLLENAIDKEEINGLLCSVQHDVFLLNDKCNSVDRDLFYQVNGVFEVGEVFL